MCKGAVEEMLAISSHVRGGGAVVELTDDERAAIATRARALNEEGFRVNHRKTRAMHRSDRQVLTGIVVNARANVPRSHYDRLKAVLHNCVRFGAASQNRDGHRDFRAHLAGRVAYVTAVNPSRGEKLAAILKRIDFGDNTKKPEE